MEPLFELDFVRAPRGTREQGANLARQLRAAIADGRLAGGTRLPALRRARDVFGVSRNTAATVYDALVADGLLVARRGSGVYVGAMRDRLPPPPATAAPGVVDPRLNAFWLGDDVRAAMGFWRDGSSDPHASRAASIDFRPAMVDARLFPLDAIRRASTRQWRALERAPARLRSAQGNQGHRPLREAVAGHIALTRALACTADDVIVTSGAQQAFDLLARTLVVPGRTVVAIEDPGYPPLRVAFAAAGARLVPVGVDDEGLAVDRLPPDVGVIAVTPSHQFPLGVTMSARRRAALLAFARRHGAVVIEDDYDGEFRFADQPLAALRSDDAADVVFHVGTFSKCMLPSLRLGYVIAPGWARATLVAAKNCLDWHTATPVQRTVAAFVADGALARHVRRMRRVYGARRDALFAALARDFDRWLVPIPSSYGMHVTATTRRPLDLERIVAALDADGVRLHTLARYWLGAPTREGLVFGLGTVDLPALADGLAALRRALPR